MNGNTFEIEILVLRPGEGFVPFLSEGRRYFLEEGARTGVERLVSCGVEEGD